MTKAINPAKHETAIACLIDAIRALASRDTDRALHHLMNAEDALKMTDYVTAKDIVIPAGTPLYHAPSQVVRSDVNGMKATTTGLPAHFAEAIIAVGNDAHFAWTMHIDDALKTGVIVAAGQEAA